VVNDMSANVPAKLIVGDTWTWNASFQDYPASTWTVTFYFQAACGQFSVSTSASGNDYVALKAATETAAVKAGRYQWHARAESGGVKTTIAQGWLEVQPDPSAMNVDPRSDKRKLLDAIDATLLRKATADQSSMAINGRMLSRIPIPELEQLRTRIAAEVRTEELGSKAGAGRQLKSRITRA